MARLEVPAAYHPASVANPPSIFSRIADLEVRAGLHDDNAQAIFRRLEAIERALGL